MPTPCCDHHDPADPVPVGPVPVRRRRFLGLGARFLSWFLAFSGLYAMGAVCPFCGRQGCPTGAASAGLVGLVFASLMQWGRALRAGLAAIVRRLGVGA